MKQQKKKDPSSIAEIFLNRLYRLRLTDVLNKYFLMSSVAFGHFTRIGSFHNLIQE